VVEDRDSRSIHKTIKEQTALSAWVFIDMAGFTSDMRTPVVSRADLMIVPMQASPEDARLAAHALSLIESDEETLGRSVEKKILWALTVPNMMTRVERKILAEIAANNVPTFSTHLSNRAGYRAMMLEATPLAEVDQTEYNGIPKAIENADQLAAEVAQHFLMKKQEAA
jgi:chromosome partitioning protein